MFDRLDVHQVLVVSPHNERVLGSPPTSVSRTNLMANSHLDSSALGVQRNGKAGKMSLLKGETTVVSYVPVVGNRKPQKPLQFFSVSMGHSATVLTVLS